MPTINTTSAPDRTARAVHLDLARSNLAAARKFSPAAQARRLGHYGSGAKVRHGYLAAAARHRRLAAAS